VTSNIGGASPSGSATFSQSKFTVSAGGADIWGTSDQFRFVYQPVSGDVEIIARIDSFTPTSSWSKVGVMIRADLSAASAHASALLSGSNGLAFQRRTQTAATSSHTSGGSASAPRWVRLVRRGTTLTAYGGFDGGAWTQIGSATIALGQSAYVGLAISSHTPGSSASAVVSNVAVLPLTLPSGQKSQDIGSPALAGTTSYQSGTYTITAAGADIWGSFDQFRYVYQPVTGDTDIIVRVKSIQYANSWSKAGVMIRESLSASSRYAMALMSAGKGSAFIWRLDTGGLSDSVVVGSGAPPAWVRLKRSGFQFNAYRSTDGSTWTSMGTETIPMANTVYVGLAVTSHNASSTTTAVFDQLKIVQSSQSSNQPPSVTLTAPTTSRFTAPANITLSASASDPENRLARVEFYSNGTRIGTDTTASFGMTWSSVPIGTYSLTAVAFDSDGGQATSPAVTIDVQSATSTTTVPKTVVFHASADHATLVTSYRLDVFRSGANPSSTTPIASSSLGKPTPNANGDITVDRSTFFSALAPATYVATVSAIGSGGESRSTSITFVR